jgi:putative endonuclease
MRSRGLEMETLALCFLEKQGFRLLRRNFICRNGEIDLICVRDNLLIFVEVRFRSNIAYGRPEESILTSKQRKIITTAKVFLKNYPRLSNLCCRFDVIAVTLVQNEPQIDWIPNAFQSI